MPFYEFVNSSVENTVASLPLFLPEVVLCCTILLMLLLRVFDSTRWIGPFYVALAGTATALWFAVPDGAFSSSAEVTRQELFTGLLVYDWMTVFFRCLLLFFAVLFCLLTRITGIFDREDAADFFSLVLGGTLGFCLMASANHLLMVFLAVEMASVPSYVLAGMLKNRRKSSEAALKYSVYGAGAAGVMLYGISLLCGVLQTAHIPTMATQLISHPLQPQAVMVLALGGLMVMVGLAFKLSAVPFHFWCPDVFEGASAEVNAFLSVASKAAALALLIRVSIGLGFAGEQRIFLAAPSVESVSYSQSSDSGQLGSVGHAPTKLLAYQRDTGAQAYTLSSQTVRRYMIMLLTFLAALTCTFGNLAAYGQTNIKRLLAYSTIAHAGYMLMPVPATLVLVDLHPDSARTALSSLAFYVSVYLFMNLGAFAIVAFIRNATGSEEIADYAGLVRSNPLTVVCLSIILISLIGIPPLAGFVGKFFIFAALVEAGGPIMITLLVIAGFNTVISLVYYLRVIKVMSVDPEPDSRGPVSLGFIPGMYIVAVTLPVLILGIRFDGLYQWAQTATSQLF